MVYNGNQYLLPLVIMFFQGIFFFEGFVKAHRKEWLNHRALPRLPRGGDSLSILRRSDEIPFGEENNIKTPPSFVGGANQTSVLGSGVIKAPNRKMRAYRISIESVETSSESSSASEHSKSLSTVAVAEPIVCTKSTLSERVGCPLRDLRIIDHVCHRTGPAFLPRQNGIIVHVGHVRCIVERDSVLVFLPPEGSFGSQGSSKENDLTIKEVSLLNDLVTGLVAHLSSVYGCTRSVVSECDTHFNFQQVPTPLGSYKDQPFELIVLEALLGHVCLYEENKARTLVLETNELLEIITTSSTSSTERSIIKVKKDNFLELQARLTELLQLKNKIDNLEANCVEFAGALSEIVRNDEDMSAMLLDGYHIVEDSSSEKQRMGNNNFRSSINDRTIQVELLFEDYLLQIEEIISSLRAVQSNVRNTEEVVDIELDLVRNNIMKFELLLEMTSLAVGCGALITGLFGMNLVSHLEEHNLMFYYTSAFIVAIMGGLAYVALNKMSSLNIV